MSYVKPAIPNDYHLCLAYRATDRARFRSLQTSDGVIYAIVIPIASPAFYGKYRMSLQIPCSNLQISRKKLPSSIYYGSNHRTWLGRNSRFIHSEYRQVNYKQASSGGDMQLSLSIRRFLAIKNLRQLTLFLINWTRNKYLSDSAVNNASYLQHDSNFRFKKLTTRNCEGYIYSRL